MTIGLLAVLHANIATEKLFQIFFEVNLNWLGLGILLASLNPLLEACRWRWMCMVIGKDLGHSAHLRIQWLSALAGQFLPSTPNAKSWQQSCKFIVDYSFHHLFSVYALFESVVAEIAYKDVL